MMPKNFILQLLTLFSLLLSLGACATVEETSFYHNVEGITEQKLQPSYWLKQTQHASKLLLTSTQISALNQQQFASKTYLNAPLDYPETLSKDEIRQLIQAISTPSKYDRFYPNGTKLTQQHYQAYLDEMAIQTLAPKQTIEFGLVVKRAPMRTFPTLDRVLNSGMDFDIDRFQETGAFPGEAVAILHTSKTGEWLFVQNYHYRAWIQAKYVAKAPRKIVAAYHQASDFLMVTGDKIYTTYDPYQTSVSEVQLDMGTKLPLIDKATFKQHALNRQNPITGHLVQLPTRNNDGTLTIQPALIAKSADVHIGYLPFTKANIIKQGFKFLGERYGWGHDFNGRDCTGFIGEIHKTFGLLMPRNTGQQSSADYGVNTRFAKGTKIKEKMKHFQSLEVGDLLYLPGHVAMFLGYSNDGKPFIIHDVHGLSYTNSQGEKISGLLNGVSVTPLLPFKSYLKGIYNIKRIR
ncbi:SH3 domain-containing protein [Thalassotalea sp. G2M2-11]|uniref:C40 family peptidase n=1 Tax=Thalassotalea sp. G2M2-11 TaxID=2787627 RepID=UPI001F49B49F|nr:SH3 domain-containing protein [Thalassotalea sp. G2M2-11]